MPLYDRISLTPRYTMHTALIIGSKVAGSRSPDPLLASERIHLVDPLLTLPCSKQRIANIIPESTRAANQHSQIEKYNMMHPILAAIIKVEKLLNANKSLLFKFKK